MRTLATALIAVAFLATPARGQTPMQDFQFQMGVEAFKRGDYATALHEWWPLAADGNPDAQRRLGELFEKGLGVPRDPREAARWYRLSAGKDLTETTARARDASIQSKTVGYYVTSSGLNIRSGAGPSHPVVSTLRQGTRITVHDRKGDWVRISDRASPPLWVYGRYLAPARPEAGR